MLSRRTLVGRLAATAAAACTAQFSLPRNASARVGSSAPGDNLQELETQSSDFIPLQPASADAVEVGTAGATEAPWELVHPLRAGSALGHGWRVADLSAVADGSCVLTLQNGRGRPQRVHVCRNDGDPQGLVYTDRFDLVVMNGGQGDLPTEEGMAQAVAAVAHVLAANEGERHREVMVALLAQGERVRRFSGALEHKLR